MHFQCGTCALAYKCQCLIQTYAALLVSPVLGTHLRVHASFASSYFPLVEMPQKYATAYNEYLLGIDERYMQIKAELSRNVNRLSANAQPTETSATRMRNPLDDLQLQRVKIERFAGDYREWPNFKSKFEQFFRNNAAIPSATKFSLLDEL